jgi:rhodanese-related sulfurtransferase
MLDRDDDVVILDSRPWDEYRVQNIPGGISLPGAELAYRARDAIPSPNTFVVVNCAGRTRSIIGAQTLINAGIPNRVAALRNGTMGWHLAGLKLERGADRRAPAASIATRQAAPAAARRAAERFGVRIIGADTLAVWRAEIEERSLYLLDVRSPEEYEAGHPAGSISAPGGQLVQATDHYIGTRNARLVLIDDDEGVRAVFVASWMQQLGFRDTVVLRDMHAAGLIETGMPPAPVLGLDTARVDTISAAELAARMERGEVVVIDLARSLNYRAGHIPGAWFAIRARLKSSIKKISRAQFVVLTSEDGRLARLVASEATRLVEAPVRVLDGGTTAWRARGLPLAHGDERMADEPEDVYLRPYHLGENQREDLMRAYLEWEFQLLEQLERDGDLTFGSPPLAMD